MERFAWDGWGPGVSIATRPEGGCKASEEGEGCEHGTFHVERSGA
jgi:hypothetical protein